MPWTRLDDAMCDDDKVLSVSPAARWLFVACILNSRRNQTAGELSRHQMAALLRHQGLKPRYAAELVEAGLLTDIDYGYTIPHYDRFNPLTSTERVRKHRQTKRSTSPLSETQMKRDVTDETNDGASVTRAYARAPRAPRAGLGLLPQPVPVPKSFSSTATSEVDPALPLVLQVEEAFGRTLSAVDREKVALWPSRYEHLPSARMVEIVKATLEKFSQANKQLHSPTYCEGRLRDENAEAVDQASAAGVKAPRYGLEHIGSILEVRHA